MNERLKFPVTRRVALIVATGLNAWWRRKLAQKVREQPPEKPPRSIMDGGYI